MSLQDLFANGGFWELEEASGNRADSTANGLTLTDNNTVTQQTGKVGNCGQFTAANTESLSHASTALLQPGPDFMIQAWIYMTTTTGYQWIVNKDGAGSSDRAYSLYQNAGTLNFFVTDGGTSSKNINWGSTLSATTWYHIVAWYVGATKKHHLTVNNGTPVDEAGNLTNQILTTGTAVFKIGDLSGGGFPFNGRIDQVGFGQAVPTAQDITDLYNSGNGLSWAAMGGGAAADVRNHIIPAYFRINA